MKQTKEELEQACKKLQKVDRWYGILVVSGAALVLLGVLVLDNLTIAMLGILPVLIALIFLAPRFRCPYCGSHLTTKFGLPSRCPRCGESLSGPKSQEK